MDRQALARTITEQEVWIAHRGGTLDGYLKYYINDYEPQQIEHIWEADLEALREYMDQYYLGISRDEAKVRQVLGDGYYD